MIWITWLMIAIPLLVQQPCIATDQNGKLRLAEEGKGIKGRYIVQLNESGGGGSTVRTTAEQLLSEIPGSSIDDVVENVFNGFTFTLEDDESGVDSLRRLEKLVINSKVALIEQDQIVTIDSITQCDPPNWGLDRIDQMSSNLDLKYTYGNNGTGVDVCVIDSGVMASHSEFGANQVDCAYDAFGGNCEDDNGHGTHVAGTVAGETYGVAKGARIKAMKVLDETGYGSVGDVIVAIDACAQLSGNVVGNLSLQADYSLAMNNAINGAVQEGVFMAAAAGNYDGDDACKYSPASSDGAMTVASIDRYDRRSEFSNDGECVDIFAPGESILSAWIGSDTANKLYSGTSMATPHVAGYAAILAEKLGRSALEIKSAIIDNSLIGEVSNRVISPSPYNQNGFVRGSNYDDDYDDGHLLTNRLLFTRSSIAAGIDDDDSIDDDQCYHDDGVTLASVMSMIFFCF